MSEHQEDVRDRTTTMVVQDKDEENYASAMETLKSAQRATEDEHSMGLREGIRKYPKAVFWSIWFSSALIMEGFDHAFVSGFFAFPAFQERYGTLQSDGSYQVPANLQSAVSNGVNAGEIVGLLINGLLADWIGYRWVMIGCLILMTAFIFLQFFATSIYMYLGAEILLGVPWGVFQTLTTTYAAEVCPNVLRPYLTMLVSLCWSIGYLLGTGVLRAFLSSHGQWAYRIPFALQWILPIPLAIGIFLAPESPWWLIRKGRTQEAGKVLHKLRSKDSSEDEIADTLAMMEQTVKIENEMKTTSSYWDLFKGVNLRRTEVTVGTYLIQELCAPLVAYIVYFLEQAGLPATSSFDFGMGEYALAIVGVFIAWYLVPKVGRRTLVLSGTAFMAATTFVIGFMGIPSIKTHPNIGYGIGSILLIEYFVFFITIGPIIYTIVTEIPSNYLRNKSVVLARAVYNVAVLVYGQLVPHMMQKASWNWGAKSGFFYGSIMGLGLIWAYFRLPETKNRTFAEMDILFKNEVKARDFSKTKVDIASETVSQD
ncbi:Maltose permease MAL61 [Penicillium manginii]|jgi:SP family general alpha glucoside:H+ symporter-like MFS transporter|uniref:Maltose permease MAL61 n=1 Tax=Penicillium manginii TaxID=203109 RepID=UPI002549BDF7|nr:Maltose permease MAL61 [Penicillium manginii]KAJ5764340.1 Maltose permease MAL61 [Penicillium manginii]